MTKNRLLVILGVLGLIFIAIIFLVPLSQETRQAAPKDNSMADRYKPARNFLTRDIEEKEDYGLYSYILFTQKPEKEDSLKYTEIIKSYLDKIPELEDLSVFLDDSSINVVYYPTVEDPRDILNTQSTEECINWLLENYDYARASYLLGKIDADLNMGPYIVSYKFALSNSGIINEYYLLQDFSKVHYKVVSLWMDEFLEQSSLVEFWNNEELKNFSNDLRNAIAIGAEGLTEIKKSFLWWEETLQGWIVFRN